MSMIFPFTYRYLVIIQDYLCFSLFYYRLIYSNFFQGLLNSRLVVYHCPLECTIFYHHWLKSRTTTYCSCSWLKLNLIIYKGNNLVLFRWVVGTCCYSSLYSCFYYLLYIQTFSNFKYWFRFLPIRLKLVGISRYIILYNKLANRDIK